MPAYHQRNRSRDLHWQSTQSIRMTLRPGVYLFAHTSVHNGRLSDVISRQWGDAILADIGPRWIVLEWVPRATIAWKQLVSL